jgi:hypothetical protein
MTPDVISRKACTARGTFELRCFRARAFADLLRAALPPRGGS